MCFTKNSNHSWVLDVADHGDEYRKIRRVLAEFATPRAWMG